MKLSREYAPCITLSGKLSIMTCSYEPLSDNNVVLKTLCYDFLRDLYFHVLCLRSSLLLPRYALSPARDRKVVGDVDGARRYGSTARCLNIISTIIVATVFLALIIVITVLTTTIFSHRQHYGFPY
uniref:Uncharacterized protein n=1 Tax=Neolamprologus brichardi TaxID=32507 RepID=A0A3Q4HS82_NEOBR